MSERAVVAWSTDPEGELLYHSTLKELLEDETEDEITVYGWARVDVRELITPDELDPLRDFLDTLDSLLGNPNTTKETPAMRKAARVFLEAVLREYTPFACEKVLEKVVRRDDYV